MTFVKPDARGEDVVPKSYLYVTGPDVVGVGVGVNVAVGAIVPVGVGVSVAVGAIVPVGVGVNVGVGVEVGADDVPL